MNKTTKKQAKTANEALYTLSLTYHDGLPVSAIDQILVSNGFQTTEPAIYCGRDGQSHEQISENMWLSLTWHKMDSGRYEVVAYIN
jgi:hypothetical protein